MIVYITGASASGKATIVNQLPGIAYDLDEISRSDTYPKTHMVKKAVKRNIDALVLNHNYIVFVGSLERTHLLFTPDKVFIVKTDYQTYYRDKILEEFRLHFFANDTVQIQPFDEFKQCIDKMTTSILNDFPMAEQLPLETILEVTRNFVF